jgi:SAM-dependent methyltransferase
MIGIDIDTDGLKVAASRHYKVGQMDISQALAFKDNSFDAVHMRHVIEHLPNPLRALQECHRILKPEGKIICSTPDIGRCGLKVFYSDYTHLRPFTKVSLFKIAYDAGFREHRILNGYIYVRGSKLLIHRGLLNMKNALTMQSFLYKLGFKRRDEIILVGKK